MKKILTIAWWEYITKVRTKTFLISLILMPALIIAFGFLPTFLMEKADIKQKRIGVVDLSGWIFDKLEDKIKSEFKLPDGKPNYVLIRVQARKDLAEVKTIANKKVIAGEFEAYIIIPEDFEDSLNFQYVSQNVGNIRDIERFKSVLQEIVIASELEKYGVDKGAISKIMRQVKYNTIKISKKGEEEKTDFLALFFSSYIFIIALMILVLTGGQMLVRSVVEEKSNRVVEVLLSSCNANELMAGKIIGLGMLGLTQMFIWAILGFYFFSGYALISIKLDLMFISLVYFVLGYLFYSALFVAIGAPVNSEYEAQQIAGYIALGVTLPIVFSFLIMQNPDLFWIKVLSFFPLFTSAFMVARIPVKMPATWEIIGTITILVLSVVFMIWVAGRIFRIAILSYGKFPSLRELLSWVKAK